MNTWTVSEPIGEEMLAALNQARTHLFSNQKEEEKPAEEQQPTVEAEEKPKAADEPGKQDA